MRLPTTVHYIVTNELDQDAHEYATLDEACDAVVLHFPPGREFTIRRIPEAGGPEVVLRAARSTTRQRSPAS
jgi:hypothetical protein